MRHQNHQFDYLEEEWNEKIHLKFNCCNVEFWSNASLRDEAPDEPIWFTEEEEWDEKIPPKFNCCNDELWSNASLRDEAPESPIWLPRRRMKWKNTSQI